MRISVRKKYILQGVRSSACQCPVALAIKSKVGEPTYVGIFDVVFPASGKSAKLPDAVLKFIRAFDSGSEVAAFHFDLDL